MTRPGGDSGWSGPAVPLGIRRRALVNLTTPEAMVIGPFQRRSGAAWIGPAGVDGSSLSNRDIALVYIYLLTFPYSLNGSCHSGIRTVGPHFLSGEKRHTRAPPNAQRAGMVLYFHLAYTHGLPSFRE